MTARFYNIVWLVFLGIAAIVYVSGNMTPVAGVVFGFAVFGWIFMGMMCVLPVSITHPTPTKAGGPSFLTVIYSPFRQFRERLHVLRVSWTSPGIEVSRPKVH